MSASIVIPTTMRRETVAPVVEAALASIAGIPGAEVILVLNGPSEGRRPLEVRSPSLRVIECPAHRASAARNVGLRRARNDAVLFTDDDCLISPEWVKRLTQRLDEGEAALATPLKMRRAGPVTTFIDYQRTFHPRPIDAATVEFPIGASVGIRRDLIGFAFDDGLERGDDVLLGARLRDAGISTNYVADAPAPIHLVPERLQEVTTRFFTYGTTSANVLLRRHRPQFSIPYATPLYSSLCRNAIATPRRFEEIADPSLRQAFAALELMVLAGLLVGYLDEAGRLLGREIIRLDEEALANGWLEIEHRLREDFAWDGEWAQLPVDFGRWFTPRETRAPVLAAEIAENLTSNAPLTHEPGPDPDLDRGGELIGRRAEEIWVKVNEVWGELRDGRLPAEEDAIASRLREDGVAFRDGLQTMEAIALGPVQPALPA